MLRTSGIWLVVLCFAFAAAGAALAADTAQTQTGAATQDPGAATTAACPMCGKVGELCPECLAQAKALMTQMAGDMCPNCEAPNLCANCQAMVDAALAALPTLAVTTIQSEPLRVAYLAGKASDDMEELMTNIMVESAKQGLMGKDMHIGCMYPDVMANGYHPDSTVYACLSLSDWTQVTAPLQVFQIPAGTYLQVDHWGDYAKIGETWLAAFAYADLHGLKFGQGPCGEVYVTDPSSAPMDKWLTEVYIPLANDGADASTTPDVPSRPSA